MTNIDLQATTSGSKCRRLVLAVCQLWLGLICKVSDCLNCAGEYALLRLEVELLLFGNWVCDWGPVNITIAKMLLTRDEADGGERTRRLWTTDTSSTPRALSNPLEDHIFSRPINLFSKNQKMTSDRRARQQPDVNFREHT
jgi:hypothetical protein